MGYNMHAFKPNYVSNKIAPLDALNKWRDQEKLEVDRKKTKFNEIAELAQMLHSPASYIGCAIYKCDSGKTRTLFLCVYDQQIKSLTKPSQLFESGKACESDKECTTHNNSACDFATGMCVRLPTATGVLVETSIKFFHYMALLFNSFRSRVSMGIAKDSNGSMLPSAANMYKLMHSIDHTTNYSLRIGSWCLPHTYVTQKNTHQYFYRLNHDDPLYHELTTGVAEQRRYDKLVLKAFKQWEKEMLSTQLSFTKSADPHTHQVPEIAQMIVGSHTNLGCSIHDCKPNNYILLVCVLEHKHAFFKHPHNYLPYQSGRPCMLDSDCTYFADSRCDVSSGLCEDGALIDQSHKDGEYLASRYWPYDKPKVKRMQQMALYMFNDYREQLAEGRITHPHQREKGARVMFLLTWSQTLAEEAAKAIESCHEPSSTIFKQPLAKEEDAAMFIESAIEHWVETFSTSCILCTQHSCPRKKDCEIFNGLDTEIGCAVKWCSKEKHQLAHCKFRSVQTLLMAYLKQHYPYPEGPACSVSKDNICAQTYANSVCIESMGLCVTRGLHFQADGTTINNNTTVESLNKDVGILINQRRYYLTHMQHFYKQTTQTNQALQNMVYNSTLQEQAKALSQSCWELKPFEEFKNYRYTLYTDKVENDKFDSFYGQAVKSWWNKNRLTKHDNEYSWRYYKSIHGHEFSIISSPEVLQYGCGLSVCKGHSKSHHSLVCVFSDGAPKHENKELAAFPTTNKINNGLSLGETKITADEHTKILKQINEVRKSVETKMGDIQTPSSQNSNYRQAHNIASTCKVVNKPSSQNFISLLFEKEYESYPAKSIKTSTFIEDAIKEWKNEETTKKKMTDPMSQHASCAINYCDFKHLLVCVFDS